MDMQNKPNPLSRRRKYFPLANPTGNNGQIFKLMTSTSRWHAPGRLLYLQTPEAWTQASNIRGRGCTSLIDQLQIKWELHNTRITFVFHFKIRERKLYAARQVCKPVQSMEQELAHCSNCNHLFLNKVVWSSSYSLARVGKGNNFWQHRKKTGSKCVPLFPLVNLYRVICRSCVNLTTSLEAVMG